MDIILLIVASQLIFLILYLIFLRFYFLITSFLFLLYIGFKYFDYDEFTGNRAWPFLRKFTWGRSNTYRFANQKSLTPSQIQPKTVFVVMGNKTNFVLFTAFGTHANVFKDLDLVYFLPRILFYIPFLRDVLLWSGAVTNEIGYTRQDMLLKLLAKGKHVVYCPEDMNDLFRKELEMTKAPNDAFFQFAIDHQLYVVPVLIKNESLRYNIWRPQWIHRLQEYCYKTWGWPFPLFFFIKDRKKRTELHIGTPMDAKLQKNSTDFYDLFKGQLAGTTEVGGDDRELILK